MNAPPRPSKPRPRVYFLGSGPLGIPALEALATASTIELVGVGTQPDRPSGRHRHLHATPLGQAAEAMGLKPNKPACVNHEEFLNHLRKLNPDLVVVVAFGQLLKRPFLDCPPSGCLNVHASLLPRYRGASPIQAVILNGDPLTGVTFMRIDEGLDTGPAYRRVECPLTGQETAATLEQRLATLAGEHLVEVVEAVAAGQLAAQPQDNLQASYARKIRKAQGWVDWQHEALAIARQVRAFTPWPGSFFYVEVGGCHRRLQIAAATAVGSERHGFTPGQVVQADKQGWTIACGSGFLHLFRVIPEGRPEMTAEEFLRGARLTPGTVLPIPGTAPQLSTFMSNGAP